MKFHVFITLTKILMVAGVGGTGFVAHAWTVDGPSAETLIDKQFTASSSLGHLRELPCAFGGRTVDASQPAPSSNSRMKRAVIG